MPAAECPAVAAECVVAALQSRAHAAAMAGWVCRAHAAGGAGVEVPRAGQASRCRGVEAPGGRGRAELTRQHRSDVEVPGLRRRDVGAAWRWRGRAGVRGGGAGGVGVDPAWKWRAGGGTWRGRGRRRGGGATPRWRRGAALQRADAALVAWSWRGGAATQRGAEEVE